MTATTYSYVWEYEVREGCERAFEEAYGPEGTWVELFRRAPGYLRTELLRDREHPRRYLTVDSWESAEAWRSFREALGAEFEEIDARCEDLTVLERELGTFDRLAGSSGPT